MTKEFASGQKSHAVNNEGVSDWNVQVVLLMSTIECTPKAALKGTWGCMGGIYT
jgi:hypothetical protein